jgi:serine/threonine-protein kinase
MSPRCPDADELRGLLADRLPRAEAEAVEAHVEACPDCQRALEQLTAGTGVVRQLQDNWPTAVAPPPETTRELSPPTATAPGPNARSTDEVPRLLRKRLLFIAVALLVTFVVYAAGFVGLRATDPVMQTAGALVIPLTGGLAVLLWRRRSLSLGQLRWVEVGLFGGLVLVYTCGLHVWFPAAMLAGVGGEVFGTVVVARGVCFRWFVLIVLYGILIPNTWRRCAAVVGVLALWCVLVTGALVVRRAPAAAPHFILEVAINMAFAAALAVYGSHRIETLRRQASEVRKLGRYRLTRRLGSGGMGEVWLAEHVLLRRPCAVKLIRAERLGDPQAVRRFEREVQATAALSHPNTVEVYDYGLEENGTFYYAMEYLPGLTLQELVERDGPLPPPRAVHLLRQVCGALAEAHAAGLVHRDVKPANVIVCDRGGVPDVAKLLDFGLARARGLGPAAETLTEEGTIAGTPAYMSPEQARGSTEVDARSDLYSVGALAYFLLAAEPPFVRDSAVQTLAAHLTDPVTPLSRLRQDVPADLEAIVLRCLEKEPAKRFPSAEELGKALADVVSAGSWATRPGG